MKSDFRTSSSRGWLRPLLGWAPSTLLLLTTLTTLLLNTEYSSAVISEHTTVDNSWIKLNENFPPRYDAAGHRYSRFFYARDKITDRMHLRNETIAEITGKDITMFHVQFDVVLSKGLTERPERLNTPTDLNWNHVSEQYTEEQFKNFELWLYAQPDCNDSLFAIKDLTVTYNSYIRLEDKVKQPAETFIQLTPDDLELSVTGMEKHQYILQDKLCHKPEGCTLKIKLKKEDNLKVHFWSSVEGDKLTAGTKSHETPKQPETKIAVIELVKDTDLKKTTDNHYELTIRVVTATENSLAIVQIGDDDKREYEQVETPVGHWEQVNPSLFNEFLNNHKGKAQLFGAQSRQCYCQNWGRRERPLL
ncbi:hypothetical protein TYRP_010333 [Tyrophagus putrescentiae]|nr:hypothetical protein TYRP_010333 [Tyrophagus putrescentiae]